MSAKRLVPCKFSLDNTNTAYGANEILGIPKLVRINPNLGLDCYCDHVELILQDSAGRDLDIFFFQNALATPPVDNTAAAMVPAEVRAGYVGRITVKVADFTTIPGSAILHISKAIPAINFTGGRDYYVVVISSAFTPVVANCVDVLLSLVELASGN